MQHTIQLEAVATARLAGLPATVVQANFRHADKVLAELGIERNVQ